jgi:hypothetical protein
VRKLMFAILFVGLGVTPTLLLARGYLAHSSGSTERRDKQGVRPGVVPPAPDVRFPECADAPARQAYANPVTIGGNSYVDTDVANTTLAEAQILLPTARVPHTLPSWVTCSVADVSLNRDGSGSLTVNFYESNISGPRALLFQVIDHAPPFPPPCEGFPPLGEWTAISGHSGFYEDSGATGGQATGHRIAWTDAAGRLFELGGAVSLQEALAIAASVPAT